MPENKKKHRKLRERIVINDLTEFEEWAIAVIPILAMVLLIIGAWWILLT